MNNKVISKEPEQRFLNKLTPSNIGDAKEYLCEVIKNELGEVVEVEFDCEMCVLTVKFASGETKTKVIICKI